VHSIITIFDQNIYIEDYNSKFGTLVLVQSPNLKLVENLPLFIQVGRTFLECRINESFSFFSCCGTSSANFCMNYYYNQNLEPRRNNLRTIFTVKMDDSEINESKTIENKENKENNRYNNFDKDENIKKILKVQQNTLLNTGESKNMVNNIDICEKSDNTSKNILLESEN
jgi:hypothetical protein